MKIYHCLADDGRCYYGQLHKDDRGCSRCWKATFAPWTPTETVVKISKLLPPLLPPNIFALGLSYHKHADETGIELIPEPLVFMKAATSVIGPEDTILLPVAGPEKVDYEVNLRS